MRALFCGILILLSTQALASPPATDKNHRELQCLALNVYFEARGESAEGQLAVALVSMNRVKSPRFPRSICSVVWQPRQFSWTHDGKSDRPRDQRAWDQAQKIALFVYNTYHTFPDRIRNTLDITKGAMHYYAPRLARPYWAKYQEVTRSIGGHIFLRKRS